MIRPKQEYARVQSQFNTICMGNNIVYKYFCPVSVYASRPISVLLRWKKMCRWSAFGQAGILEPK